MVQICIRTVFFYFFISLCYRIMGKREIGQLGIIDLIISMLMSELVAISIEKHNESIFYAIIPILLLTFLEVGLGYVSLKSRTFNKIFGGKPSVIISNGKIMYKNMISQRYGLDDLLLELRKNSVASLEEVEYAFLEADGSLSVFKYKPFKMKNIMPLPIIIDGSIQKRSLIHLNKDKKWLDKVLDHYNLDLDEIFYAIYDKNELYVIRKKKP